MPRAIWTFAFAMLHFALFFASFRGAAYCCFYNFSPDPRPLVGLEAAIPGTGIFLVLICGVLGFPFGCLSLFVILPAKSPYVALMGLFGLVLNSLCWGWMINQWVHPVPDSDVIVLEPVLNRDRGTE